MKYLAMLCGLVVGQAAAAPVAAEPPRKAAAATSATESAAATTVKPDNATPDRAKAVADEAAAQFKAGQFVSAAGLFEQAFALSPDKWVRLRNAGRAWEEAGRREQAAKIFARYVESAPDGPEKDEVAQRLARLRAVVPSTAAPVAVSAAPKGAPPAGGSWQPWAVVAAGAFAVAGGGVWLGQVHEADARLVAGEQAGQYGYPAGAAKAAADRATVDRHAAAAWAVTGAGIAAVVGGVAWHLWPQSRVAVGPSAAGRGAALAWRF